MTGTGPSIWTRRFLTLVTAMVLLTPGAATALADPDPSPGQPTPSGAPTSPSAAATPEDERLDIFLNVSIAPAIVSAGDLVTIEGTITDENEAPISGARLSVLLGDKESKDSLVVSADSGAFQTFVQIPPDSATGTTDLVVSFAGDDAHTPGLRRFDVTVGDLPVGKDSSSAQEPPASPDPTSSTTANASGSATAPMPATSPSADTAGSDGPMSWFYVALIVVGGIVLLIAAALVFRGMYGHKPPARLEDHELDTLLQPNDASDSEEGALLSDSFSEVDRDAENADDADGAPTDVPPHQATD